MKKRVLILCTGNSARSQMAEGLLLHEAGEKFDVESAGTKPGVVRPEAIAVMREAGIDVTGHGSKHVDEFAGQQFDCVITVCDNARETCPVFFGKAEKLHHDFEDPGSDKRLPGGTASGVPARARSAAGLPARFQRGHRITQKKKIGPPAQCIGRFLFTAGVP